MTFREYIQLMRRRWWVLTVLTLVGVGAAGVLTAVVQPAYVSQSSILISMSGAQLSGGLLQSNDVTTQRAATYASLGTSSVVLDAAAAATGTDVEDLEGAVSVVPRDGQAFLDVTATATTAAQAQEWSQAVADRLVVAAVQSDQIGTGAGLALQVVSPASLPQVAVSPRPRNNVLIGAAAGLIIGACVVVLWSSLDQRIRSAADVTRSHRVSSVVVLPGRGKASERTAAERREAYRRLHATLRVAGVEAGPVAVAGVSAAVDVRSTTLELGRAIASAGRRVVVVDVGASAADGGTAPGLVDVLAGTSTLDAVLAGGDADGPTLLPSGGTGADALARLHGQEFERLLSTLSARFDCVLLSCPPPGEWSPTLLVAAASRSTVLVARRSSSTTSDLADAVDALRGVDVRAAHVLLD